ncbi:MAG: hypothetical protein KYX68_14180 [Flavobacterium sp.]|nr:hypothetical protein [Flavobacterium sp.]
MAYSEKKEKGKLVKVNKADYRMGGTIAGLDLLGGGAVKGFVKGAKGFIGKARQFLGKKPPKKGFFKPMHRDGKVYDKQSINDAFTQRFGSAKAKAKPTSPKNQTNFGRVDRASQMRNIERGNIGKTPRFARPPVKK